MPRLPVAPNLDWSDPAHPRAVAFDDVYSSRAGALEQARAVFLSGSGLPERWAGRKRFAILELGFGAGINALATWEAWARAREAGAVLHFVSIEAFPLSAEDAARAHEPYREIAPHAERLRAAWPVRGFGPQRVWLDDSFCLTVIIGDARECAPRLEGLFDSFFLDGFAPARNPELWSGDLLRAVAAKAAPDARAATYSVAGDVRRALEEAGFAVEKKPGFAGKRERLEARLNSAFSTRHTLFPFNAARTERVAIIGGGIAGACMAHALARRGAIATLHEAEQLGAGASGSPAALLMPRLDRDDLAPSRLYRAAYLEALRFYEELGALDAVGVEERAADARDRALLADLGADPPLPRDLLEPAQDGLFHPCAGTVTPLRVLEALTDHVVRAGRVDALERVGAEWIARGEGRALGRYDSVILCAGAGLGAFGQAAWLPLEYSRGQLEWGAVEGDSIPHAIASGAYAAPTRDGVVFGATFDAVPEPCVVTPDADSTARNLAALARLAPDVAARVKPVGSRAALRVSANDRMPIVGLAPDARAWTQRFASLKDGRAPSDMREPPPAHEGLYVFGALGARGFLLAPILAERLASEICGEPQALDRGVIEAIHPARFLIRALKRGQALAV